MSEMSKPQCSRDGDSLTIENELIRRTFDIGQGFRTTELVYKGDGRNLVDPRSSSGLHGQDVDESAPCRELALSVDGHLWNIGLGEGFSFDRHEEEYGDKGEMSLRVYLAPACPEAEKLELVIEYILYPGKSFLVKKFTLTNKRDTTIVVDSACPEVLTMPAVFHRWRDVTRTVYPTYHPRFPGQSPFNYCLHNHSPEQSSPVIWCDRFVKSPERFGFAMANDYVTTCATHNVTTDPRKDWIPLPGSIVSQGHAIPQEIFTRFPVGPKAHIKPSETFESFRTFMTLFEGDFEDGSLAVRRMCRDLCPWVSELTTTFKHSYWPKAVSEKVRESGVFDMEPLKKSIDQAAELGFDFWFFSSALWASDFGSFTPRPEFPNGVTDMRKVVDYAHAKGLKVSIHTNEDYGVDFEALYVSDENGKCLVVDMGADTHFIRDHFHWVSLDSHGRQTNGWVMCGSSGWHQHLMDVKFRVMHEIGVDEVATDGCYYGDMCHATNHEHHSPEESQYLNWKYQVIRYRRYMDEGFQLVSPDWYGSFFHGNRGVPSIPDETFTCHDPYDFIRILRKCLYISTYSIPNTALNYGIWTDENVTLHLRLTDNPQLLDYYFASICSYGVKIRMLGEEVYDSPKTREIVAKWIDFIRGNHAILCGDVIHLSAPTGTQIDAVAHVDPELRPQGLIVAFNPTRGALCKDLPVPVRHLGGGVAVEFERDNKRETVTVNEDGNAVCRIELPPRSYAFINAAIV